MPLPAASAPRRLLPPTYRHAFSLFPPACSLASLTCTQDEFNETPTESTPAELPAYLEGRARDAPVMMYCTGGIRCDVYSAYLRQKG